VTLSVFEPLRPNPEIRLLAAVQSSMAHTVDRSSLALELLLKLMGHLPDMPESVVDVASGFGRALAVGFCLSSEDPFLLHYFFVHLSDLITFVADYYKWQLNPWAILGIGGLNEAVTPLGQVFV
jgi:hypothetical protein